MFDLFSHRSYLLGFFSGLVTFLVLALILTMTGCAQTEGEPVYFVHEDRVSYDEAVQICSDAGAELADNLPATVEVCAEFLSYTTASWPCWVVLSGTPYGVDAKLNSAFIVDTLNEYRPFEAYPVCVVR
jgi:hypothetical protein